MKADLHGGIARFVTLMAIVASAMAVSSCSLIGFTTGIILDGESTHDVELSRVDSLKPGVWLMIILDDSTRRAGRLVEVNGSFRYQYPASYTVARQNLVDSVNLPRLGATETILDTASHERSGEFIGFDLDRDFKPLLLIKFREFVNPRSVLFSSVRTMKDTTGNEIDLHTVGRLIGEKRIPVASKGIAVSDSVTTKRINMSDIVSMEIDDHPKEIHIASIAGLVFGLAVDLVCYTYVLTPWLRNQVGL
ncbi:MAG TPA: hypothetical protein VLX91_09485 [Candidatus Acidoferrales bacterium]|nr:hypothetical protein [Candidatus Acidoferrales bacterium]